MRLSIEQNALEQALKIIAPAIESIDYEDLRKKGESLPLLANVLLRTEAARLMIAATSLELTIITFIGAKIDVPGEILLPFKLFNELVSVISPEAVYLLLDDKKQKLNIKCGLSNSNMQGTLTTQYPTLPAAPFEFDLSVDAGIFRKAVKEVVYAVGTSLGRPILTGVHLITQDNQLRFEAANEWRMAIQSIPAEITKATAVNIPAHILKVAAKAAENAKIVQIAVVDGKVYFEIGKTLVIGQTLEGIFPDVQRLIPSSFLTNLRVCREEFQRALRRAEIFAKDNDYYARIVATDTLVDVSTQGSERGNLIGSIDTELVGEALEVGVNIKYIQQALSAITTEWVLISGNDPKKPIIIKPEGETAIHFIAPMNLR